ncbi:hypothetical protein [Streptomyces sp. NPDC048349]|uniref:hypothetical protein n=1 Tax=Streptomyces sp. NPDC048349 TaxID=3155486 RepID=UPI003446B421
MLLRLALTVTTGPFTVRFGEVTQAGHMVQLPAGAESGEAARTFNPAAADQPLPLGVLWTPRTESERITRRSGRQPVRSPVAFPLLDPPSHLSSPATAGP